MTIAGQSVRRPRDPWIVFISLLIFALAGLVLVPVASVLMRSFHSDGASDTGNFAQFFASRYFVRCLTNTFIIGIGSMLASLVVAVPMALLLTRYAVRGAATFRTVVTIGMLSPAFLGAFCWILLFGDAGVALQPLRDLGLAVPSIYGPGGIILVSTLHSFPMVFLIVSAALTRIDPALEEAAASLGRPPTAVFFTVSLPLLMPAILTGGMLVFLGAISDWGTAMLIGQGERFPVLATVAYSTFVNEIGTEGGLAAVTSTILLLISVTVAGGQLVILRRLTVTTDQPQPIVRRQLTPLTGAIAQGAAYSLMLLTCLSLLTISILAFLEVRGAVIYPALSLGNFQRVAHDLRTSIWNSILFSGIAFAIVVVLGSMIGYLSARRKDGTMWIADALVMLPYFLPGTVFGIGLVYSFGGPPFLLTGTAAIIVLAYVVRRLPYMVRTSASIVAQIDGSLEEASLSLGYPPLRTFGKVMVPLMAPGILAGALLVWLEIFNELSASIVLYTARTVTLPIMTYQYAMTFENGPAAALGFVQTALTLAVFALLYRLGGQERLTAN
ncbi:ABC transporter permease [Labrys monachus]|uniref:Iron(III) transport system permease protein n=1 Tax=Labrys monachus TaxID=217067 RepID=A0ABU0FFZ8_9HYPH|nr:iron ABC transporter permease [Labrys monachus]MDQ0393533.1 iron(III) transport system permease protein [Labrys monachus]